MNTTIRAIVINPFEKLVQETEMPNDFDAMKRDYIKCDIAEVIDLGEGVDAWIDEEGNLKEAEHQAYVNLTGSLPLAGNVVLIGRDPKTNNMAPLPESVDLELVRSMCFWIGPDEMPPPTIEILTLG